MKFSFIFQLSKNTTLSTMAVIRKAPVEKASTYEEGFITMGVDNNKYIVMVDKKNTKRWMKTKTEVDVFFEAPEPVVETQPAKPKRAYKKKVCEVPAPEPKIDAPKPKRAYNKKIVKQYAEMGTQTDEVKKERKPREPKN